MKMLSLHLNEMFSFINVAMVMVSLPSIRSPKTILVRKDFLLVLMDHWFGILGSSAFDAPSEVFLMGMMRKNVSSTQSLIVHLLSFLSDRLKYAQCN